MPDVVICSECFHDQGLRLDAEYLGTIDNAVCPNCGSTEGYKLKTEQIWKLAHRFFVWGTLQREMYGASPMVQFNQDQTTSVRSPSWLVSDIHLIERSIGVGFFPYGPHLWMLGEVEPLKLLQNPSSRQMIIDRIISEYPTTCLTEGKLFYRIRKTPNDPEDIAEYDSPPSTNRKFGRLDSKTLPIMYCSQDLSICVHECRVTAEDDLYVATLSTDRELNLLDLSVLLHEDGVTEFDSLDMAVHMLFLAGDYSYDICREIATTVRTSGYDGLIYPSYFSLLKNGCMPFETTFGLSNRIIPSYQDYESSKMMQNIALFGKPIQSGLVRVNCINRLILRSVEYGFHFGPVGCG